MAIEASTGASETLNQAFTPLIESVGAKINDTCWLSRDDVQAMPDAHQFRTIMYDATESTDSLFTTASQRLRQPLEPTTMFDLTAPVGEYGEQWARKLIS